ncbi:hypothetical protein Bca101_046112 [Brassica carinata]
MVKSPNRFRLRMNDGQYVKEEKRLTSIRLAENSEEIRSPEFVVRRVLTGRFEGDEGGHFVWQRGEL